MAARTSFFHNGKLVSDPTLKGWQPPASPGLVWGWNGTTKTEQNEFCSRLLQIPWQKKQWGHIQKASGLRHAAGYFGRSGTTYCRQAPAISNTISHPAGKMNVYEDFFLIGYLRLELLKIIEPVPIEPVKSCQNYKGSFMLHHVHYRLKDLTLTSRGCYGSDEVQ